MTHNTLLRQAQERALNDRTVSGVPTLSEIAFASCGPGQLVDDAARIARWARQALQVRIAGGLVWAAFDLHGRWDLLDGTAIRLAYANTLVGRYKHEVPPMAAFEAAAAELRAEAFKIAAARTS